LRWHPVSFVFVAGLLSAACIAQQPAPAAPPDLQDVLLRLQDNLWDYQANIPDFFADEHVVSTLKQEGRREVKTTTDSVFRLVRSHAIGEAHIFNESREIKLVNKKAARGSDIHGPAIFSGAFSTAPGVVSLEMSRCFDYNIDPPAELNKAPALLISYAFKPEMLTDDSCPGPEKESGRAWVDPTTFHVLRIEMVIPNHRDNNGTRSLWSWTVDFAPVAFDSRQFWMPKTIVSRAEANDGSAIWAFTATYSSYHKLTVKSHIITDVGDNPQ
jgi:hypothetical protein